MNDETRRKRLQRARTSLLLGTHPQYVFLSELCEIPDRIHEKLPFRAATDGVAVHWRADFIDECDDTTLLGVLVHELLHIGLFHLGVIANCDDKTDGNIAADLALNSILLDMGMNLPEERVTPGEGRFADWPHKLSMEEYYARLQAEKAAEDEAGDDSPDESGGDSNEETSDEAGDDSPGDSNGDSGDETSDDSGDDSGGAPGDDLPAGSIVDPGSLSEGDPGDGSDPFAAPAETPEGVIESTRELVENAMTVAEDVESRGSVSMPGSLKSAVTAGTRHKVDYRKILRQFRSKLVRGGSDWNRLNKRMRSVGINAARRKSRKVGDVLVLLDCSGSMRDDVVQRALTEITGLFKEVSGSVHVWQHDTRVIHRDEWKAGRKVPTFERRTKGGTDHRKPFEAIAESGINPDLVICITDFESCYPEKWRKSPVIWIGDRTPEASGCGVRPPFGKVCDIVI